MYQSLPVVAKSYGVGVTGERSLPLKSGNTNMPKGPHKGESQDSFMSRCVPKFTSEGKSKEDAVEQCNGMWYSAHPEQSKKS